MIGDVTLNPTELAIATAVGLRFQISATPPAKRADTSALVTNDEYTTLDNPPLKYVYVGGAWQASGLGAIPGAATKPQVLAWAENILTMLTSPTANLGIVGTTAIVNWPDGVKGVFTTKSIFTSTVTALSYGVDGWTATYVGSTTITATSPVTTKDANGVPNNVPVITVA